MPKIAASGDKVSEQTSLSGVTIYNIIFLLNYFVCITNKIKVWTLEANGDGKKSPIFILKFYLKSKVN